MRWLFLAFLIVPAAEIGVFIWAGGIIGPWWVVFLILLTGLVGVALAKKEGIQTWNRAQRALSLGQVPTREILDGICIFTGGVFLFTPGFITDITGFVLVFPGTRDIFKRLLSKVFKKMIDHKTITYHK
ncbi:FxsA family protein [Ornithinibacillus xuwenensis]|uniref:FxsA family protein n=1 Tax=Ornithinibacillus xuwenensis TaxID=3144668 RepID=A0ABU9XBE6_9BACI